MKNKRGFTILELIIVIALISIIGAIIAPSFLTTTDKVKIKSDIQSAKIIKAAISLYEGETGLKFETTTDPTTKLIELGYLDADSKKIQSEYASWKYDQPTKKVTVVLSKDLTSAIMNSLSAEEKSMISQPTPIPVTTPTTLPTT